ncbi:chitobiase/beta-hexosaminidase C-terminal domain-containing protein [Paenibacillus thalictri]|uniref:SLH domain-containing protein n=1 Tax=Paenibacillus thalictri TaxID=2527873 RepID=A0A4Q9DN45_9BACL|nr:chitobiase/beta-hexosaminidase C-terminal domain-containing protein [Paenibacillus thalictri]TBL76274.1 hypothetical protein EYB31_19950 [Paenibacillus thalictri]
MALKQKSIYAIVFAGICIALLAGLTAYQANASTGRWTDGSNPDTSWFDVDPTFGTFTINTPAKLAGVAKLVNDGVNRNGVPVNGLSGKRLEVNQDLDLSAYYWMPIGTDANPFKGTLITADGLIKEIRGMKVADDLAYGGLIGYMDGATVGGFKFTSTGNINMPSVTRDVYVGAAVGKMVNNSYLYDITNDMTVTVNSGSQVAHAGGIIGQSEGNISNLVNNGAVTVSGGTVYAGGVTGSVYGSGLNAVKLWNYKALNATGQPGKDVYAGGIAGYSPVSIKMSDYNTAISNSGNVTVSGGANLYAGGILGKASGLAVFSPSTTNSGAVTVTAASATSSYAGALAGSLGTTQAADLVFANTGIVTNNGGSNAYTGGLAGYAEGALTYVQNYTNSIAITVTGKDHLYTGGLVGYASGNLIFKGATKNTAVIQVSGGGQPNQPDEAYTGGLVGYGAARVLFDNTAAAAFQNSGALTVTGGTGLYTGGIVGNGAYARTSGDPSDNVTSIADIRVTGVKKLYTGGFIGIVPQESVDKAIAGATFANDITVTAMASGPDNTVSTGGIVGYYVNGSGNGSISGATWKRTQTGVDGNNDPTYSGGTLKSTGGGAYTYTGGIAGYVKGGQISGAAAGNTAVSYATITADGFIGGIAGYLNGTINTATVKYLDATVQTADGYAGGIAGTAQGAISGATVGDAAAAGSDSVKLAAPAGIDRLTAGGLVGQSEGPLTATGSLVTRIALLNEAGKSGYNLGGMAGILAAGAQIGAAGSPVEVKQLNMTANAVDSNVGGAIGINRSEAITRLQIENVAIQVPVSGSRIGGAIGLQEAVMIVPSSGFAITAQDISIVSPGSNNQIGGIAGKNTGVTNMVKTQNHLLEVSGDNVQLGGIAGRSEAPDNSASLAGIAGAWVRAGEQLLLKATGANAMVGGIAGSARNTEIKDPVIDAELPDTATISVTGANAKAGGIAGNIENSKIVGDAVKVNVDNLFITSAVSATAPYIGGIAGYNDKTRVEKMASGNVNLIVASPNAVVGGMTGYNLSGDTAAVIVNNHTDALSIKVNPTATPSTVGGIVGVNDRRVTDPSVNPGTAVSTIQNSRIVGTIQVTADAAITGGMVGENRSLIANNSISDKISVISRGKSAIVGGLAGVNTELGTLYYTYSNANLTVEGENTLLGGLVGENRGQVIASYVDIDISGSANGTDGNPVYLGGVIGRNSGTIDKSYSVSKVTAKGSYTMVGGLVGEHAAGSITNSYAAKEVIASSDHSFAGGLLGRIVGGTVTTAYSAGKVTASGEGSLAGGFAGHYDNTSKELLFKTYYVKDVDNNINEDLPDFAEGTMLWLNVQARLSTILAETLRNRDNFPSLSGWDFVATWRYGSLDAVYKYPELIRVANSGGETGNGDDVNANINWYMRDPNAFSFELKTEAELAGLAAIVNGSLPGVTKFSFEGKTIKVANPIHIQSKQWTPIGIGEDSPFEGSFNGNNQLIDGLTLTPVVSYSGLFGVIGQQGKVENIRIEPLAVAGQQFTGVLAGVNKGAVANINIKLLNGAKVSGGTVGSVLGKNTGTVSALAITLEGGSRIEATGANAVAGGLIGDNAFALNPGWFTFQPTDASIGSAATHATVGGLIGRQTGDVSGMNINIATNYRISTTGANNILGGLIGQHVSGKADRITVTFTDSTLQALGAGSTLGGIIGQSDSGSTISNATLKAAQSGQHMTVNGIVGGIVGTKEGRGTNAFDLEAVKVDNVTMATLDGSAQAVLGGIAGKLSNTALKQAEVSGALQAAGEQVIAGGIAGQADNSILYMVKVTSDIEATAKTGVSSIGGVAGIISSSNVNLAFDFGKLAPFYRGIYNASVTNKTIKATGSDSAADMYVGGIAGKNTAASIYHAESLPAISVSGGKTVVVGGIAGYSSGVIVSSAAHSGITADTSRMYHVGGAVGQAGGGEIHYVTVTSTDGGKIAVSSTVTKPGMTPAAYVGGFAGTADNTLFADSFTGLPVQVVSDNQDDTLYAGGFAGLLGDADPSGSGSIQRAYATGNVEVQGITGAYAGGFAGSADRYAITEAYTTGNVANTGFDTRTGGFAGVVERSASVKKAYAVQEKVTTTGINHATRSYTGGFAGYNDGTIENAFAGTPAVSMNVTGANAFNGAFVGYNFRNGKVTSSSYLGTLDPIGRNLGSGQPASAASDVSASYGFGGWSFDVDASYLSVYDASDIAIQNAKQFTGVVTLYNDPSIDFYKLFNRTAAAKPDLSRFSLGTDVDMSGVAWIPFGSFRGEFDGKGKTIKALKGSAPTASAYGFAAENYGKIANIAFVDADIAAGANTGIVAGINHTGATISGITLNGGKVQGADYTGGAIGLNSGTADGIAVNAAVSSPSGTIGGIAGANEGKISKSYSRGTVRNTNAAGAAVTAGGITGENTAAGEIAESFSFANIAIGADQANVGGIAGVNSGKIGNTYFSGRLSAEGTTKVRAGGIAGYAAAGTIGDALNVGEVTASSGGKIVKGQTFFGGIAGQKEDAAMIAGTAFNKQMLKADTAYYNAAGKRIAGTEGEAAALMAKDMVKATPPIALNGSLWQSTQGYYPQLAAFSGKTASKLSAAAVVFGDKDSIYSVKADFTLTGNGELVWSAATDTAAIESGTAGSYKGTLKTAGSADLTAAVGGDTRTLTVNAPAPAFSETAQKPRIVSGDNPFSGRTSVVLATDEAGGKIVYTLDGSQPDAWSTVYAGPIAISGPTTIKAMTMAEDKENSEVLPTTWMLRTYDSPGGGGGGGGAYQPPVTEPAITANIGSKTVATDNQTTVSVAHNSKLTLTAPEGQTIYYTTDGSTPTKDSPRYTGEILITGNMTIKMITDKNDQVVVINYRVENAKYNLKDDAKETKYISGYENNEFKPDNALSRYEIAYMLNPLLNKEDVTVGNVLKGVDSDKENLVAFFTSAGIIEGYPDNTFGGDKGLTRAEFVVVMSRVLKLDISEAGEPLLSDIQGHWSEKYINAFTKAGYVQGFPDGTFKPDSPITRAEAVVLINRITGMEKQDAPAKFTDLPPSHWAYQDIMAAAK